MSEERRNVAAAPESAGACRTANEDDVRAGYQAALQMAVYDGQLSWQVTGTFVQFAILMIAGAVFPSFVGSKDQFVLAVAGLCVSLAGLVMTSMFGSMVMRVRTYEEYWTLRAIELESYLDDVVETLSGSIVLSRTGSITVGGDTVHMRQTSAVKSKQMLKALFLCFIIVFIVLLGLNGVRLVEAITLEPVEVRMDIGPTPGAAAPAVDFESPAPRQ